MVPPVGNVTSPARPRPSERAVVEATARYLEGLGYRTRIDPDGTNYFDLVARRGDEVGLIEAKVSDARTVLTQALVRRGWGDWVAVVLASRRSAIALEARSRSTRAAPVGVWWWEGEAVTVVRAARPWVSPGEEDPYAPLRVRFRGVLDALDRGDVPEGLSWSGVPRTVRRLSGGRGFREWRLDEPGDPGP
ncbi:MAG: hypothetical protein L3K02_07815 [Thermoplasmata archaeon]|nr:hypothetical protein [Thermoplasmata archaeon]